MKTRMIDLSDNYDLEDISFVPSNCTHINLSCCNKVKVYTKTINNENGCLTFINPPSSLYKWPYYKIESHYDGWRNHSLYIEVVVKMKSDNEVFMEEL